jgi:hypothetical protein
MTYAIGTPNQGYGCQGIIDEYILCRDGDLSRLYRLSGLFQGDWVVIQLQQFSMFICLTQRRRGAEEERKEQDCGLDT